MDRLPEQPQNDNNRWGSKVVEKETTLPPMQEILREVNESLDKALSPAWSGISAPVVKHCKGVFLYSMEDRGLIVTGHDGCGVLVAHNDDESWSAPSAVTISGGGLGLTVGYEKKSAMVFIMDPLTLKAFGSEQSGSFGASIDLTAGPVGRAAEVQMGAGEQAVGATYVYYFSKGAFVGLAVKSTTYTPQSKTNTDFYGKTTTQQEILDGSVKAPEGQGSGVTDMHKKLTMLASGKTN